MLAKASLHIHTKEDFRDGRVIDYSVFELIDKAKSFDFSFLALTGHEKFICRPEFIAYAKQRGITLIPGIELSIKGKHVLLLNCESSAEVIDSFETLKKYKTNHPESFVVAPHPNYGIVVSLSFKKIRKHADIFDAIEHSWYYSKVFNLNKYTERLAKQLVLPFIATSDVHNLFYLNQDYLTAEVSDLSIPSLFEAIKNGKFSNISNPKPFWELVLYQFKMMFLGFYSLFK